MAKAFAKSFYNSKEWQQARENALMRDGYMCQRCGRLAEEVHHIVPLTSHNIQLWEIALDEGNLISLCYECHKKEHRRGERKTKEHSEKYYIDIDGYAKKKV